MRRTKTNALAATFAVAVFFAASRAACADLGGSLGAGAFFTNDGGTAPGIVGTLGLGSFPVIPIRPQVTGAYLIPANGNGSGYVVTGEGQFGGKSFFAGAGFGYGHIPVYQSGIGSLGPGGVYYTYPANGSGFLVDGFAGVRIARYTSLQLRYYGSVDGSTGSATYLGVSFGF